MEAKKVNIFWSVRCSNNLATDIYSNEKEKKKTWNPTDPVTWPLNSLFISLPWNLNFRAGDWGGCEWRKMASECAVAYSCSYFEGCTKRSKAAWVWINAMPCARELWLTAQSTPSRWPLLPQTQLDSHQPLLQTCVSDTTPSSARLCDFLNKLFVIGLQSGRHDVAKKHKMWCFSVDGSINNITYIRRYRNTKNEFQNIYIKTQVSSTQNLKIHNYTWEL